MCNLSRSTKGVKTIPPEYEPYPQRNNHYPSIFHQYSCMPLFLCIFSSRKTPLQSNRDHTFLYIYFFPSSKCMRNNKKSKRNQQHNHQPHRCLISNAARRKNKVFFLDSHYILHIFPSRRGFTIFYSFQC